MKKIIVSILAGSFLLHISFADGYETDEMIQLADTVTSYDENAIDQWEVTIREHMNEKKLKEIMTELRKDTKTTGKENENSIKYSFRNIHKQGNISVVYNAVIPKSKQFKPQFTAVIKGSVWDKNAEENYKKSTKEIVDRFFSEGRETFACLKTKPDAIMDFERFLNYMTKMIDLQQVETVTDKISHARVNKHIYGYTPLWNHQLNINKKTGQCANCPGNSQERHEANRDWNTYLDK
ncbi:YwmB family TATA-box binding protein [Virgibacillus halophilus]|uniref:YwmB family TATA-box binding protein n=1 Tax=Tigheibacillus halophilus TaxID=361280 RepID=A0ABU5C4G2_9BACI|nr:YwmB family TATA-box binding protein [Virgibacillus halophilus]